MLKTQTAIFGGGCFWCTEAIFKRLKGVESVVVGYVDSVEVSQIEFDPSVISYQVLLDVFFHTHDPTSVNQQGADRGPAYRSVVFYVNDQQKEQTEKFIDQLNDSGEFDKPIVTDVDPFTEFDKADDYHQNFYENYRKVPYCDLVISPKLHKLQEKYADKLKENV